MHIVHTTYIINRSMLVSTPLPIHTSLIYGGAGVASHLVVPTFKTSILRLAGILKALLKITNLFPRLIDGVSVHFMPKR